MNKLRGVRVLLVDDDETIRFFVQAILSRHGAEVEVVEDGSLALDRALRGTYDVILMDMQMAVMGGLEALQSLRGLGYFRPIIMMTGNIEERSQCISAGADGFLGKPIDRETMVGLISSLCMVVGYDSDASVYG